MSDRLSGTGSLLREAAGPSTLQRLTVLWPAVAHVGYTGTEEDRDRRLETGIWLRRNDAALYRAWFEPGGDAPVAEDLIDLNGTPRRDFLAEDFGYDVVIVHNLWGFPSSSELGGYGPAAASAHHGEARWRRRLEACGARYIFLLGSDFQLGDLGGGLSGYESYFVPSNSFMTVLVAGDCGRRLPAAEESISCLDLACARLEHLPEFLGNRSLDLSYAGVNREHLIQLREMPHLEDLRLVGTAVGDGELAYIAPCRSLRRLNLDSSGISGAGLTHLQNMQVLECLSLNETKVDDAGLRHLGHLPRLQWLSLVGTSIGDDGLDGLESLQSLRSLTLVRTQATAARVARLRTALPECAVDFRP